MVASLFWSRVEITSPHASRGQLTAKTIVLASVFNYSYDRISHQAT